MKKEHAGNDPNAQLVPSNIPGGWNNKKPGDDKGGPAQGPAQTDEARRALHQAGASWASGAGHAPQTQNDAGDQSHSPPGPDQGRHMPPGASHNLLLGDETASRLRGERRLDSRDYPTLGDADDTNPNGGAGDDRDYSRHHSRWDEDERGPGGGGGHGRYDRYDERRGDGDKSRSQPEQRRPVPASQEPGWRRGARPLRPLRRAQ